MTDVREITSRPDAFERRVNTPRWRPSVKAFACSVPSVLNGKTAIVRFAISVSSCPGVTKYHQTPAAAANRPKAAATFKIDHSALPCAVESVAEGYVSLTPSGDSSKAHAAMTATGKPIIAIASSNSSDQAGKFVVGISRSKICNAINTTAMYVTDAR